MLEIKQIIYFLIFQGDEDSNASWGVVGNLGNELLALDEILRKCKSTDFVCEEHEELCMVLRRCAEWRHKNGESPEKCYKRLLSDSRRFQKIYKLRAGINTKSSLLVFFI